MDAKQKAIITSFLNKFLVLKRTVGLCLVAVLVVEQKLNRQIRRGFGLVA